MDLLSSYTQSYTSSALSLVLQGSKVFTTLSELASELGRNGVDGPRHFRAPNLEARGTLIGRGAQFEVFEDSYGALQSIVIKRVRLYDEGDKLAPPNIQSHFHTLQREIASLCDPIRRSNRNIVDLIAWGYDYPTSDLAFRLPVICMEKALCSLTKFLERGNRERCSINIRYQICLDIVSGLHAVHETGLVHGDLKPDNVLIFTQNSQLVPFIAKLSDFGQCIILNDKVSSFAMYKGSPHWLPPEVAEKNFELSEPFSPNLLTKSDSFACALLVLSVFLYDGQTVPCQDFMWDDAFLQTILRDARSQELNSCATECVRRVIASVLKRQPGDRIVITPALLDCDEQIYSQWVNSQQSPMVQTRGRKNADLFTGYSYYQVLDLSTLSQLETQFVRSTAAAQEISNDVLFGMGIRFLALADEQYRERAVKYFQAAALRSSNPAQAIFKRVSDVASRDLNMSLSDENSKQWLFNGASTGSLVAIEDLRKLDPSMAREARRELCSIGGYNDDVSPAVKERLIRWTKDAVPFSDTRGINEPLDSDGNCPMHYAASFGLVDLMEVFGRRGALVDQKNKRGETPLYKACMAGDLQSVRVLVKMNADASLLSHPFGISCLHWLFNFEEAELSEVVMLLTSQGARPSVVTQHLKDAKVIRHIPSKHFPFHWPQGTPIHWAAFARSCSAIDVLLQNGALVDELDAHDDPHAQTALSMATYRGDSMVVKHLLSRGADPCRLDGTGCSPAHMMAISSRKNRLLDMSNALRWWVYHGSWENHFAKLTECARALVAFGADLDIQTRRSDTSSTLTTPVLDAAGDKNPGALLALITAGASADCAISWSQETPIHRWAVCDSRSLPYPQAFRIVFEKLLTSVRSVDARDSNGQSLLHRAVDSPSDADFRYLTQLLTKMMPSISIKVTDADRCTPLLQAVQIRSSRDEKHDAVVRSEYLLSLGADTRVKGYDNRDYIWLVCQNDTISDSQCLGLLRDALNPLPVEEQRDLVRKSVSHRKGTTPLMCACNNSLFEVVCYLINLRADINALSKSGRTALDVALDSSAFIRQQYLNEWILERKLTFDGVQFSFNPRTILPADLLRSRGSFLQTEEAITQLFQRTSTENDLSSRVTTSLDHDKVRRYFACMDIIRQLHSLGARPGKDFVEEPEEYDTFDPKQWDLEWIDAMEEDMNGFSAELQPFYDGHWDLLYELRPYTGSAVYPESGFAIRALSK